MGSVLNFGLSDRGSEVPHAAFALQANSGQAFAQSDR
jgi:hypothetical protein